MPWVCNVNSILRKRNRDLGSEIYVTGILLSFVYLWVSRVVWLMELLSLNSPYSEQVLFYHHLHDVFERRLSGVLNLFSNLYWLTGTPVIQHPIQNAGVSKVVQDAVHHATNWWNCSDFMKQLTTNTIKYKDTTQDRRECIVTVWRGKTICLPIQVPPGKPCGLMKAQVENLCSGQWQRLCLPASDM